MNHLKKDCMVSKSKPHNMLYIFKPAVTCPYYKSNTLHIQNIQNGTCFGGRESHQHSERHKIRQSWDNTTARCTLSLQIYFFYQILNIAVTPWRRRSTVEACRGEYYGISPRVFCMWNRSSCNTNCASLLATHVKICSARLLQRHLLKILNSTCKNDEIRSSSVIRRIIVKL
jgi:hypothetical protein